MPAAKDGRKLCPRCDKTKRISKFYSNKNYSDGLASWCKQCDNEYSKESTKRRHAKNAASPPKKPKTKKCLDCNKTKSATEFHNNILSPDGLLGYCKPCHKIRGQKQDAKNKANYKTPDPKSTKHCARCKKTKKATEFYKNRASRTGLDTYCKECVRKIHPNSYLKHKYGITHLQYLVMLDDQDDKCALCRLEDETIHLDKQLRLGVDHCHKTGKVRELLCVRCNPAIAALEYLIDNELLKAAKEYLRKHSIE